MLHDDLTPIEQLRRELTMQLQSTDAVKFIYQELRRRHGAIKTLAFQREWKEWRSCLDTLNAETRTITTPDEAADLAQRIDAFVGSIKFIRRLPPPR